MIRAIKTAKALRIPQRATFASVSEGSNTFNLSNDEAGVKVATQDLGATVSTLSLVAKAGSRYETKLGVSHYLKNFAFKNNDKRTAFRITREAELQGASLESISTRESIILTAQFFRQDAPYFIELLSDVAQSTKFAEYEGGDVAAQVAFESQSAPTEVSVLDSLHHVAFRQGLGNATLATSHSGIKIDDISSYAQRAFAPSNLTFVATNVDEAQLTNQVNELFADSTSSSGLTSAASKYFGGESRIASNESNGHIVFGFEGASLDSSKATTLNVLRHLLGGQTHLKWGQGVSPLSQVASSTQGAQVSTFNFSYSDSGLFGLYIQAPSTQAGSVAEASLAKLKEVASSPSADDVKRAVAQAKFEVLTSAETQSTRVLAAGIQASILGKIHSASDIIAALEKVTEKEIAEVAKSLLSSKPSVVIQGRLSELPYADSFKF